MEYASELYHYGVKGMKWGVRRNRKQTGGTVRARSGDDNRERHKKIAKRVAAGTAAVVTVAAAATVYAKNPKVRSVINYVVSKAGKSTVNGIKTAGKKSVEVGKAYVKEAVEGAKQGAKEAMHDAPRKVANAVITGLIMNSAKRILDSSVGREEAARIFQANNNKKISSFWKVSSEDKDEDD